MKRNENLCSVSWKESFPEPLLGYKIDGNKMQEDLKMEKNTEE